VKRSLKGRPTELTNPDKLNLMGNPEKQELSIQEEKTMNFGGSIAYLWLVPVLFQIVLPIVILFGWSVVKLPSFLVGISKEGVNFSPVCAS